MLYDISPNNMAALMNTLTSRFTLTALVALSASLVACEIVDELPSDGMGGESASGGSGNGDGDGDAGGSAGETGSGGSDGTGGDGTGGDEGTGGDGTGGGSVALNCDFAESCSDNAVLLECYRITANFRDEIVNVALECMQEEEGGGCQPDEFHTARECLASAYDFTDLSEKYGDTEYCGAPVRAACSWDFDEAEVECSPYLYGFQSSDNPDDSAQADFERCLLSEDASLKCNPSECIHAVQ